MPSVLPPRKAGEPFCRKESPPCFVWSCHTAFSESFCPPWPYNRFPLSGWYKDSCPWCGRRIQIPSRTAWIRTSSGLTTAIFFSPAVPSKCSLKWQAPCFSRLPAWFPVRLRPVFSNYFSILRPPLLCNRIINYTLV